MSGEYIINPLEPKVWNNASDAGNGFSEETDSMRESAAGTACPEAFKKVTRLSQHIAFLKDFFRSYKDFTDAQIDTIEILLSKLYARFGITDTTDYSIKKPSDFPIMQDFYELCEEEFMTYDKQRKYLYTEETLQEVCLGIHSMCIGSESKYFNGHTNITDSNFLVFGVKGLMAVSYTHLDVYKRQGEGFEVHRLKKPEIKRILALYFDASMQGDTMPNIDGEQYFQI